MLEFTLRAAPALPARRAEGAENGYCLNIQPIWAAPDVPEQDTGGQQ